MGKKAKEAKTREAKTKEAEIKEAKTKDANAKAANAVGNAGVMLVGRSAQHGDVPAVLLGGRFYTGKKVYAYTDFGGGVDREAGETPQQGAFRELVEELLGLDDRAARATASRLSAVAAAQLVGGRPFVHKGSYAMYVVAAEVVAEHTNLPNAGAGASAIDELFAHAVRNSELTSVALISIEELLRAISGRERVRPLSVRQLDGEARDSEEVLLRHVLVGGGGSILTIRDALEAFADQGGSGRIGQGEEAQLGHGDEPRQRRRGGAAAGSRGAAASSADSGAIGPGPKGPEVAAAVASTPSPVRLASRAAGQARAPERGRRLAPYVFDMETGDPDDVLTLLFLGSHPSVELRAVTITPGSQEQVALVRWLLQQLGLAHIRLGAQGWPANAKKKVDLETLFYKSFGRSPGGEPACEPADRVLLDCCGEGVTLVTGAPLHNLGAALGLEGFRLGRLVAQGGFAGEGVVPREMQMDKFLGMETCPTWNFCGNIEAARAALSSAAIGRKICVSKNVCHSVYYDDEWHRALGAAARAAPGSRRAAAFRIMHAAMDTYLRHRPGGKKLHDPLALAVALDESVCELAEVQLFCQKGKWGSRLCPGSDTLISIAYDPVKFQAALLG